MMPGVLIYSFNQLGNWDEKTLLLPSRIYKRNEQWRGKGFEKVAPGTIRND